MKLPVFEFDEGFDGVARAARRMAPSRWITVAVYAVLVAWTLSPAIAVGWVASFGLAEVWTMIATAPHARGVSR